MVRPGTENSPHSLEHYVQKIAIPSLVGLLRRHDNACAGVQIAVPQGAPCRLVRKYR